MLLFYFKLGAWSHHYVVWWETATNCSFHLLNITSPSCPSSVIAFLNWRVLLSSIFLHTDVLLCLWYFFFLCLFRIYPSTPDFKLCFQSRRSRDLLSHCYSAANKSHYTPRGTSSHLTSNLLPANSAVIGYLVILAGGNQRWLDTMQRNWLSHVFLAPETEMPQTHLPDKDLCLRLTCVNIY